MRVLCIVLAIYGSFLRGNTESIVNGDQSDVVTLPQSALPRLNTDASDGPGLLEAFNKTVNTTATVTPRPLEYSAVDKTTLEEQQSGERAYFSGFTGPLLESLYLGFKRSPDKRFKAMVGGHPKAYSPGAFNKWLQYVAKFQARHGDYPDAKVFRVVWKRVPKANRKELLQLLGKADVDKDAAPVQQWLAKSLLPGSTALIDAWISLNLSPKALLNELKIDFFAEPVLAIHWLRFNEAVKGQQPNNVVSLNDIVLHMCSSAGQSQDDTANKFLHERHLPSPSSTSAVGFFKALRGAHNLKRDDLDKLANKLEDEYAKFFNLPRQQKQTYLPSPTFWKQE